ncbi:MAG TPA: GNAT family N-acetyltransferase [Rhabdochlamydiaceae bacterium]|jgi:ribosomal protein S18 acetylase RimI-like enzyme|nr:GNAT family N-acetyltransferase [Rhabdochlamydiaceae bacterium]
MRSHLSSLFREATPDDINGLAEVWVLSLKAAYQGKMPASHLESVTVAQKAEEWKGILQSPTTKTFLAQTLDKKVIGFVNFGNYRDQDLPNEEVIEIRTLYVHPEYWRRGVGTKLAELAIQSCKNTGYKRVVLWVLDSNEAAQKFYQSLDLRIDGGVKIEKRIPECELRQIRFSKKL